MTNTRQIDRPYEYAAWRCARMPHTFAVRIEINAESSATSATQSARRDGCSAPSSARSSWRQTSSGSRHGSSVIARCCVGLGGGEAGDQGRSPFLKHRTVIL